MGKSIRSKIKKFHRSIKRREEGPVERQKRALQAVALGALPVEKAPGAVLARLAAVLCWCMVVALAVLYPCLSLLPRRRSAQGAQPS